MTTMAVGADTYIPLMVTTNGTVATPFAFWAASPAILSLNGSATNLAVSSLKASQVSFSDLAITNGAGEGRILRSDAAGNGIWWTPDFMTLNTVSNWCFPRFLTPAIVGITNFQQRLIEWTASEAYQREQLHYDTDGCLVSANVVWPDGSSGVFIRTAKDATWLTVNAFSLSHSQSGLVVIQPSVSRDQDTGAVTNKPAYIVQTGN